MPARSPRKPSKAVHIRRVRQDDWPALRALRLKALAHDPLAFGSTLARESKFPDEQWKERVANAASSNAGATFVADSGASGLIGMAGIAFFGGEWHVWGMWVGPEHRRKGLGGRLLDAGLRWWRTVAPGQPIRLDVNPRQGDAVRLYESRGFRRTGVSSPLGHTEGETIDAMVLRAD